MGRKVTAMQIAFIMLSLFFFAMDVANYLGSVWHSTTKKISEKIYSFMIILPIFFGIFLLNFYIQSIYVLPVQESAQWPLLDPNGEYPEFASEFYNTKWRNFALYWKTVITFAFLAPCLKWLLTHYMTKVMKKSDDSYVNNASQIEENSEKVKN